MKQVDDIDEPKVEIHRGGEIQPRKGASFAATPDEAKEPICLSVSVAKPLLEHSPLHAWQAHSRLGGGIPKSTDATEDGKIYEAIIFDLVHQNLAILEHDAYRTDAAKAAKAAAITAKKTPVLAKDFATYALEATQMMTQMDAQGIVFQGGHPQVKIIWVANGVHCKGILDYLTIGPDFYIIDDLKCVADASPKAMQRAIVDYGWDIQAAAYTEAVETSYPHLAGRGFFRLTACEKKAPFACVPYTLSGSMKMIGEQKWRRAQQLWAPCLATNTWPSYRPQAIDASTWQISQAEALTFTEQSS